MKISKVKVRFSKYITETDKAYCLEYSGQKLWIPKKICWGLIVVGNDCHAWAKLPAWKFEEMTGYNLEELYQDYGTEGLRNLFCCQLETVVEYHTPDKIKPITDNTIIDLKK